MATLGQQTMKASSSCAGIVDCDNKEETNQRIDVVNNFNFSPDLPLQIQAAASLIILG
jgi:hypothetical protein